MKTEWWILIFLLVFLSIGHIALQDGDKIQLGFIRGFILPVLIIVFGEKIGELWASIFPNISRLSMGRAHRHPGLYIKLVGYLLLFSGLIIAVVVQSNTS